MNRRRHKYLPACLVMMGCVVALPSAAQSLSRVPPKKVKQISASLDKSLLPKGASNFEVEQGQVVAAPGITFVPVRFQADNKTESSSIIEGQAPQKIYCGLYQIADGAPGKFLLVFGIGQSEVEGCGGLKAIGAAAPHATHGDLILIYNAFTPNTRLSEPVILSWDETQKQYVVNDDLTQFVGEGGDTGYTILNIRNRLAPRAAKPQTQP
jgi:hypothetical protein